MSVPVRHFLAVLFVASSILLGAAATYAALAQPATKSHSEKLRPAGSFDAIGDRRERAAALFREAGKVLRHPRCANCHPGGHQPLQGEAQRPHEPPVSRGRKNRGAPAMECAGCHGLSNFDPARMPGGPNWQLAPSMAGFRGKSLAAICRQLSDPKTNGGKDLAALLDHMENDKLVIWAWQPGVGRQPAPGSHDLFLGLFRAWAAAGAHCPRN